MLSRDFFIQENKHSEKCYIICRQQNVRIQSNGNQLRTLIESLGRIR